MSPEIKHAIMRYSIAVVVALIVTVTVFALLSFYFTREDTDDAEPAPVEREIGDARPKPTAGHELPGDCEAIGQMSLADEHPYRYTRHAGDEEIGSLNEILGTIRGEYEQSEYYSGQPGGVQTAIEFDNGWLVGSHFGDSGGEVVVVNRSGMFRVVLTNSDLSHTPVLDMHLTPFGYVIISGRQGTRRHEGRLFVINDSGPQRFAVKSRHDLPAGPDRIWHLSGGSILMAVGDDHYWLNGNGELRKTVCTETRDSPSADGTSDSRKWTCPGEASAAAGIV